MNSITITNSTTVTVTGDYHADPDPLGHRWFECPQCGPVTEPNCGACGKQFLAEIDDPAAWVRAKLEPIARDAGPEISVTVTR